jgi:hypothetical protein
LSASSFSLNAFAFIGANIPPARVLWYVFASGCLVVAVLIVIDWRLWFARPKEAQTVEALPSAAA